VPVEAFLGGFVVVGNDQQRAVGTDLPGDPGKVDCLGGGIGSSAAYLTVLSITSACSSKPRVADSPVVPTDMMAWVPFSMWKSIRRSMARKSTSVSGCMGVTIATILP
jgi:hypothetical protein